MSASSSALHLGLLPWRVKVCQNSVWSEKPKAIKEVDNLLEELDIVLPAITDRITPHQRRELEEVLERIRTWHRHISSANIDHFFTLDLEDRDRRRAQYREYLARETNQVLRGWQKKDRDILRDLLATFVKGDIRLQGYFEIGIRFGGSGATTKSTIWSAF